MDLALIRRLIEDDDPIQALYDALMGTVWTAERLADARRSGDLSRYLREGEHAASALERDLCAIYSEIYALLEAEDPRRDRIEGVHMQAEYTLLLIDALSLREAPLVAELAATRGLTVQPGFALVAPPTETTSFTRRHYAANGPSDMVASARRYPFAFRRVTNENWRPDFASDERQRFIWFIYPDDNFRLQDADYVQHVVQPVEAILTSVLDDPTLVRPLIITSDHGYLWQGDQCTWSLEPDERAVLAAAFRHGRSTAVLSDALAATGKAWIGDGMAAVRGRYSWGSLVPGSSSLFKHGGVSLLECLTPWCVIP